MTDLYDNMPDSLPVDSVQMIAIDMDGTLLRSDGRIGAKSVEAIGQARKAGIHVVIATARPPRSVIEAHTRLKLDTWTINHNGALIYDPKTGRTVGHLPVKAGVARQVVEVARRVAPDIPIGVEVVDTLYTDHVHAEPDASHAGVTNSAGSLDHVLDKPVTKLFMTGATEQLSDIQVNVNENLCGQVAFAISHVRLLQVVGANVDKALALSKVAEHHGVPAGRVMAIGDAPNDLGMMKWAGLSVAVKNGWRDVCAAAKFVVASNDENGVAEAIHKYALS